MPVLWNLPTGMQIGQIQYDPFGSYSSSLGGSIGQRRIRRAMQHGPQLSSSNICCGRVPQFSLTIRLRLSTELGHFIQSTRSPWNSGKGNPPLKGWSTGKRFWVNIAPRLSTSLGPTADKAITCDGGERGNPQFCPRRWRYL